MQAMAKQELLQSPIPQHDSLDPEQLPRDISSSLSQPPENLPPVLTHKLKHWPSFQQHRSRSLSASPPRSDAQALLTYLADINPKLELSSTRFALSADVFLLTREQL